MNEFVTDVDPVILAVAGIVLPLILAVVNSVRWSPAVKSLIAAMTILAVGVVLGLVMGLRDGRALLATAVGLYVWAQMAHAALLRPLGLTEQIERRVWPRDG